MWRGVEERGWNALRLTFGSIPCCVCVCVMVLLWWQGTLLLLLLFCLMEAKGKAHPNLILCRNPAPLFLQDPQVKKEEEEGGGRWPCGRGWTNTERRKQGKE